MKKEKNGFYSSFKGSVPVEIRNKKDFCKLVKQDREIAEEFFTITLTPFAYEYAADLVSDASLVKSIVKKAMKRSWKKIDDFKEDEKSSLEDWCIKFLEKEVNRQQ